MPVHPDVTQTLVKLKERVAAHDLTEDDKAIVEGFIKQIEANLDEARNLLIIKDSWLIKRGDACILDLRLIHAVKWGQIEDIKIFKALGANLEAKNIWKIIPSRETLLHKAIKRHRYDTITILKQLGVKINAEDELGDTPLMFAAQQGNLKAIQVLVSCGADLEAKNKNGLSALQLAKNEDTYILLGELILKNHSLTEDDFIPFFLSQSISSDLYNSFQALISNNQKSYIESLANNMPSQSPWRDRYSAEMMKHVAISAIKTMLMGQYYHALGLMVYFPQDSKFEYGKCVFEIFLNFESYKKTLFNLFKSKNRHYCFTDNYYNIPFQESLIDSLKKFITDQPYGENKCAIEKTLLCMQSSLAYYNTYFTEKKFPSEKIIADLEKGQMIMFHVGRGERYNTSLDGFHAVNIIIKDRYLAIADRFDNMDVKDSSREVKQTGGVYIYDLKKPFSELTQVQKNRLLFWLQGEMSKSETTFEIKKLLEIDQPIAILPAKKQTKGNCRYASKKSGVGALIFLSLLEQHRNTKDIKDITERASRLQKQFTECDRLYKINDIMQSTFFNETEKEELLFMVLFRNNNPFNLTDEKICKRILDYYKKSPSAIENLLLLVNKLELELNKLKYSLEQDALKAFDNLIIQLNRNGIDYKKTLTQSVEQSITKGMEYKT